MTTGEDDAKRLKADLMAACDCSCLGEVQAKGFTEKPVEDAQVKDSMRAYFKSQTQQEADSVAALHTLESTSNFLPAVLVAQNAMHLVALSCTAAMHSTTVCSADVHVDAVAQGVLKAQWGERVWVHHALGHWGFTADGCIIIRDAAGKSRIVPVLQAISTFEGLPLWITKKDAKGNDVFEAVNPVQHLAKHNIRHRVSEMVFDPEVASGFASNDFFNMFEGWACVPMPAKDGEPPAPKIMHHLLRHVCGGDEAALKRLLTVWALKYQRPKQKLRCITVFRGEQGAGKSILMQIHSRICGPYLSETADLQQVIGRFNGHLQSLLWIVLDEAMFPGDKRAVALLKRFASAKDMSFERKFKDIGPRQPFLTDVMMTTNEAWAIPFDTNDRRYLVFDVELPEESIRKAYMSDLRVAIEGGDEVPELFHLLLNMEIPADFDINNEIQTMPNNVAKARERERSKKSGRILDALSESKGPIPVACKNHKTTNLK